MRAVLPCRLLLAALLAAALSPLPAAADAPKAQIDPYYLPDYGAGRDRSWDRRRFAPRYGYGRDPGRSSVVCDAYGRCWQRVPPPPPAFGHTPGRRSTRPPGWAYDLPFERQDSGRFLRPRDHVLCDRGSFVCYKRGSIDRSETRAVFGGRAADRADDLRDRFGTGRLFVPERGVTCDPARRACFDDGRADFGFTRHFFGDRAADAID